MSDLMKNREMALENVFFRDLDRKILQDLQDENEKEVLSKLSGIDDSVHIEQIFSMGIRAQTIVALGYIPFIAVAWADGAVEKKERNLIASKIKVERSDHQAMILGLVDRWLARDNHDELLEVWRDYLKGYKSTKGPDAFNSMKADVLEFSHLVAKSAGGLFGIGSETGSEKELIKRLNNYFNEI